MQLQQKPQPIPGALWLGKPFIVVMNWDKGAGPLYPTIDNQPVIGHKLGNIKLDKVLLLSWDQFQKKDLEVSCQQPILLTCGEWASVLAWESEASTTASTTGHPLHGSDPLTSYSRFTLFGINPSDFCLVPLFGEPYKNTGEPNYSPCSAHALKSTSETHYFPPLLPISDSLHPQLAHLLV